jgi:hypothetical protein
LEQARDVGDEIFRALDAANFHVSEDTLNSAFRYVYPENDPRRVFKITFYSQNGDLTYNAGLLLNERHRNGIGAPGKWTIAIKPGDEPPTLSWVSEVEPTLDWNTQPETPIPMRPLNSSEELFFQFGGSVGVRRREVPTPGAGDKFMQADRDILIRVLDICGKLARTFGA